MWLWATWPCPTASCTSTSRCAALLGCRVECHRLQRVRSVALAAAGRRVGYHPAGVHCFVPQLLCVCMFASIVCLHPSQLCLTTPCLPSAPHPPSPSVAPDVHQLPGVAAEEELAEREEPVHQELHGQALPPVLSVPAALAALVHQASRPQRRGAPTGASPARHDRRRRVAGSRLPPPAV